MGPLRTRGLRAQASRSRFHEGSMNDRVSAAPPVHFLGPEERVLWEGTAEAEQQQQQQQQHHHHHHHHQGAGGVKKGGNLLGQVWEGVRGRLRLRRDAAPVDERKKAAAAAAADIKKMGEMMDRPTRGEAIANYHHLVASGFFSSHAIQSTRQPPPGRGSGPRIFPPQPSHAPPPPPPQWPLTPTHLTPKSTRSSTPMLSPASASSRGTKRAADDGNDDNDHPDGMDRRQGDNDHDDHDHDHASTPKKKMRKTASRDFALPGLRAVSSRRKLATARGLSSTSSSLSPVIVVQPVQPPPELPSSTAASRPGPSFTPSSLEDPAAGAGQNCYSVRAVGAGSMSARVLRPRRSALEPLSVVPDANRGIPRVPAIPAKFTFGEDRENGQPWRGLSH